MRRSFIAWMVVEGVVAVGLVAAVSAQAPDAARQEAVRRLEVAEARASSGDCGGALAEFERVYDILSESPYRHRVVFNIGTCQERLFRYDEALLSFEKYLREAPPDASERDEVARNVERLNSMLASLVVESNVAATVWIDDREIGIAPDTFRIPTGQHTVELRAAGHQSAQQQISLATNTSETISFELDELHRGIAPGWFWGVGGLAVAVAIGGGVSGVTALSRTNVGDRPVVGEDIARVRRASLTSDILFGVAGALAITAVALAVVTDWDAEGEERASLELRLSPTYLELRGSF